MACEAGINVCCGGGGGGGGGGSETGVDIRLDCFSARESEPVLT